MTEAASTNDIGRLVQAIYRAVPYSHQIDGLDLVSDAPNVRFEWRGVRFRVATSGHADEVGNGVLIGSNIAILLSALVKAELVGGEP